MGRNWNIDEPEMDAEEYVNRGNSVIGHCEDCGSRIYKGECHIEIDGILLCDDMGCINNYIRNNYLKEE